MSAGCQSVGQSPNHPREVAPWGVWGSLDTTDTFNTPSFGREEPQVLLIGSVVALRQGLVLLINVNIGTTKSRLASPRTHASYTHQG